MNSNVRRSVFLWLLLLPVLAGLALVFRAYTIVFWIAMVGVTLVAASIPAKELYQKDRTRFWLTVPVVLAAISLGCFGSFVLLLLFR